MGLLDEYVTQRLTVEEFGQALLATGDMSPEYIMLYNGKLPPDQLGRWLLAFLCFCHEGVASKLSEYPEPDFWNELRKAASTKDFPRRTERRHFRGQAAIDAVNAYRLRFGTGQDFVSFCLDGWKGTIPVLKFQERIETLPQFGPWGSYKMAELTDRVLGVLIDFGDTRLFDAPRQGAIKCWKAWKQAPADEKAILKAVSDRLLQHFKVYAVPPAHDRGCGMMEIETILCKWGHHMSGSYPMGSDTKGTYKCMKGWGETAAKLVQFLPVIKAADFPPGTAVDCGP